MTDFDVVIDLTSRFSEKFDEKNIFLKEQKYWYFSKAKVFRLIEKGRFIENFLFSIKHISIDFIKFKAIFLPVKVSLIAPSGSDVIVRNQELRKSIISISKKNGLVVKITSPESCHKYEAENKALDLILKNNLSEYFPEKISFYRSESYICMFIKHIDVVSNIKPIPFIKHKRWCTLLDSKILSVMYSFYRSSYVDKRIYNTDEVVQKIYTLCERYGSCSRLKIREIRSGLPANLDIICSFVHGGLEPGHVLLTRQSLKIIDFDGFRDLPILWDIMWYPLSRIKSNVFWDWISGGLETQVMPRDLESYYFVYNSFIEKNFNENIDRDVFRFHLIILIFLVISEAEYLDGVRLRWMKKMKIIVD